MKTAIEIVITVEIVIVIVNGNFSCHGVLKLAALFKKALNCCCFQ